MGSKVVNCYKAFFDYISEDAQQTIDWWDKQRKGLMRVASTPRTPLPVAIKIKRSARDFKDELPDKIWVLRIGEETFGGFYTKKEAYDAGQLLDLGEYFVEEIDME